MSTKAPSPPGRRATFLTGFVVLGLTMALIVFSEHGYHATVAGLKLFAEVVFPSLLPFFILSEVLLALGMVHFLGVFFEPLMRPLFNVPGVGSFVFSMGLAAGYPMDAVLTAKFRRAGMCNQVEAERLLAFTNTADPLFLFGAVAVGMFGQPELGLVLALAHYVSVFLVGLIFRFWGYGTAPSVPPEVEGPRKGMLSRALSALYKARLEDGRPLGKIFNDAIAESMGTLFMIGSFIVLFSVLLRVLEQVGVTALLLPSLQTILGLFGLKAALAPALLKGIFEIDLGSAAASQAAAPLAQKLVVVSAIIAWSGLSVHGQVISVLTGTDIRLRPYFLARLLHAVLAGVLILPFLGPLFHTFLNTPVSTGVLQGNLLATTARNTLWSLETGGLILAVLLGAGILVGLVRTLRVIAFRWR